MTSPDSEPRSTPAPETRTTGSPPGGQPPAPNETGTRRSARGEGDGSRLFVLDTSVLMHDPTAPFRFQEHDVYLPMVVLEELDAAKKGTTEIARNVREVGRLLDEVVRDADAAAIGRGILLSGPRHGARSGRLFLQTRTFSDFLKIRSLNFMRGRTFLNRYVILDEAQNLTRYQMKTLITRAGPGTKMVCLGNVRQIDTPWLSETTSGLTYVVDRFKQWPHSGHVTLVRGERSRLADFATESL